MHRLTLEMGRQEMAKVEELSTMNPLMKKPMRTLLKSFREQRKDGCNGEVRQTAGESVPNAA